MAQVNETINIGSKADTRGFKQAETAAAKLTKQVKSLATAFGLGLGTAAIVSFGKASVKAFAEDEKAALSLSRTVKNLGLEFGTQGAEVNNYISNLEQQTGVLDDELRPALDRLLRSTLSITKAQELLNLALDISAGTGKSVTQVSQSLQKAYLGQTQALGRLGVGLSKAELSSSSFEKIQKRLTYLFAGQAQDAANSYAGQIDRLTIASNNAKETIGKGLVDALVLASGKQNDIQGITNTMDSLATFAADAARGVGVLASYFQKIDDIGTGGLLGKILSANFKFGLIGQLAALGERNSGEGTGQGGSVIDNYRSSAAAKAAEAKRAKELAAAQKKQLTASKALTAEQKKQAALKKAGTIFDLEQVQLIAALKGKLSDEERKRVELQFAIITGNVSEAQKLTYELARAQGFSVAIAKDLASMSFKNNPFASWEAYLDTLLKKAQELAKIGTGGGGGNAAPVIPPLTPEDRTRLLAPVNPNGISTIGEYIRQLDLAGTSTLPVTPSVGTGQGGSVMENYRLNQIVVQIDGKQIAAALQDSSMSGTSSSVNRLTGGWL
jgi:hypothetical protein